MELETARKLGLKKIGEVAEMFDTTARTLLFYEEMGIISPRRTSHGTRIYSESDIKRFDIAYRMATLGIPVKTIRDLVLARTEVGNGDAFGRRLAHSLDLLKEELANQIRLLQNLTEDLDRGKTIVTQCTNCKNPPTRGLCPQCPSQRYMDQAKLLYLTGDIGEPTEDTGVEAAQAEKPVLDEDVAANKLQKPYKRQRKRVALEKRVAMFTGFQAKS